MRKERGVYGSAISPDVTWDKVMGSEIFKRPQTELEQSYYHYPNEFSIQKRPVTAVTKNPARRAK